MKKYKDAVVFVVRIEKALRDEVNDFIDEYENKTGLRMTQQSIISKALVDKLNELKQSLFKKEVKA